MFNRVVEWEIAAKSQRAHQRGTPEISERLRKVGWGRRGSTRAVEPEFLDARLEGGGLEAQEGGGPRFHVRRLNSATHER